MLPIGGTEDVLTIKTEVWKLEELHVIKATLNTCQEN